MAQIGRKSASQFSEALECAPLRFAPCKQTARMCTIPFSLC